MTETEDQGMNQNDLRFGGTLLAATAALTLGLVMHHPVLRTHTGIADIAAGISSQARIDHIVHGGLMAILGIQALGFYIFSTRLGFRNPAVAAGFLAFAAGAVIMVVPATLDGFVTPDLTEACLRAKDGCTVADARVLRLVALMIQGFTKVALVAISVGTAFWSMALLMRKGPVIRCVGMIGVVCAGLPVSVLFFSDVYLQPSNLVWIIAGQVVWGLMVAVLMIFSSLSGDPARRAAQDRL